MATGSSIGNNSDFWPRCIGTPHDERVAPGVASTLQRRELLTDNLIFWPEFYINDTVRLII